LDEPQFAILRIRSACCQADGDACLLLPSGEQRCSAVVSII
jgi:hypothetical protein